MASLGNLTLVLSARIGDGEPHDIGEIDLPVVHETTHTVGHVSITARVRIDDVELNQRLQKFAAAVTDEMAAAAKPDVLAYPPGRMIGSALTIDPSPVFNARLKAAKARQATLAAPAILDGPEHVIIGARQEGKTRLTLKWLTDAPEGVERVLIITDNNSAEHLKSSYGLPKNDPRIISYRTLLNKGPRPGVEYGVDDTAHILTALLGLKDLPRLLTVGHAEAWQGTKK